MKRLTHAALIVATLVFTAGTAAAVPATMSFTARLSDANGPVEGSVNMVFRIFDAPTGGTMMWQETQTGITAEEGLIFAVLGSVDPVNNGLDGTVFDGSAAYLEIEVNSEVFDARVALFAVPYAVRAASADTLGDLTPGDVVTSVTAGVGLSGGGAGGDLGLSVDTTAVQARVTGTCSAGQAIRVIAATGLVTCEAVGTGDITDVIAGVGLTGGSTSGAANLAVDTNVIQRRVGDTCPAGSSIRAILANGTVQCETDDVGTGDITAVTSGSGLTGGGTMGDVNLAIAANGVTSTHLATGSVTTAQILDSTITATDLAANSVGASEIATNAVGASEIADGSVQMRHTSGPVGFGQNSTSAVTNGVARSFGANFTADSAGSCFVTAQTEVTYVSNGRIGVRPVRRQGATNFAVGRQATTPNIFGTNAQVTQTAAFDVSASQTYSFGCETETFGFTNGTAHCQVSWICN